MSRTLRSRWQQAMPSVIAKLVVAVPIGLTSTMLPSCITMVFASLGQAAAVDDGSGRSGGGASRPLAARSLPRSPRLPRLAPAVDLHDAVLFGDPR